MRERASECMHAFNCFCQLAMDDDTLLDYCDPQEGAKIDISGASKSLPSYFQPKGLLPSSQDESDVDQDDASQHSIRIVRCFAPSKTLGTAVELLETEDRGAVPSQSSGVAGILYKWVNLGKGWRPRWFVLEDGVLSYYKVHGPYKITLNHEKLMSLRIIGEESKRLMKKQRNIQRPRRSFGEVHLQVSSIRKSKSEDKRFYIYTGTKTLHLRAETKEDRTAWLEALRAAKESFQISSPQTLPPYHKMVFSTEKLRSRLSEEGLTEDVIRDCEAIMKAEFSILEEHFRMLEQQNADILRRLRQLEVEKLELETTVMDESQNQDCESTMSSGNEKVESETDSDDFQENEAGADTDEEDDVFFDTNDFLSSESFGNSPSISRQTSAELLGPLLRSDDSVRDQNGEFLDMKLIGFHYHAVERRKQLPDPKEDEQSFSLWSIIKNNIGKDLTKICLPVYFNEPLSSLQKCFEDMEYSYLLDQAYEWGRQGNGLMRILNVAAFAVSGYASTEGRARKPFNPLLGETYEADYPDKGLRFISEKVSHHPMILACHCEGRGWTFWGDCNLKSKFWGRSIQLDPVGILRLRFADSEMFQWSKVTTSIYNLILGRLYCDHYGTMRIQGINELSCKLKFKEESIMERNPYQVQGFVHDKAGTRLATLFGKWNDSMYFVLGDLATKPKGYDPMSEAVLLWRCSERPKPSARYNFTPFAITLNEITPGLKEKLPPTDSRLRPDQRYLENGEYELANTEKLRLEQKQRQARKLQESGWQPCWFAKSNNDTFEYVGGYWESRENSKWDNCANIFGSTVMESPS